LRKKRAKTLSDSPFLDTPRRTRETSPAEQYVDGKRYEMQLRQVVPRVLLVLGDSLRADGLTEHDHVNRTSTTGHQKEKPGAGKRSGVRCQCGTAAASLAAILALLAGCAGPPPDAFALRCADREAVERVYYRHRLGTKPPFGETLPRETLEALVRKNIRKEATLREIYGVEITPALLSNEVRRINTTTRAPGMLAEIKAALGNDPERFANAFAKPVLVERILRQRFENDEALHAAQRQACETLRRQLIALKADGLDAAHLAMLVRSAGSNRVTETTWKLGTRPAATKAPSPNTAEIRERFGPDAKLLSSPSPDASGPEFYFEDLPHALQKVLQAQLRRAGDVSAVIETPSGFVLYLAKEKDDHQLAVACMALPKRSYEQWLEEPR